MKLLKVKSYDDTDFVFVNNHWDVHLSGLCIEDNKLCSFKIYTSTSSELQCSIYSLTVYEKLKLTMEKKLFEWCIGYHWSYKKGKQISVYGNRWPKWFWKRVFKIYYRKLKYMSLYNSTVGMWFPYVCKLQRQNKKTRINMTLKKAIYLATCTDYTPTPHEQAIASSVLALKIKTLQRKIERLTINNKSLTDSGENFD